MRVQKRFLGFFQWSEMSQEEMAGRLGCGQSYISKILGGKALVHSVAVASAIERESAEWPSGPLLAVEWDPSNSCSRGTP